MQISKFERLCQKEKGGHSDHTGGHPKDNSNIVSGGTTDTTNTISTTMTIDRWVKNLFRAPLPRPKNKCWSIGLTSPYLPFIHAMKNILLL